MKYYGWNPEKNEKLKSERDVSFEQVVWHIHNGDLLSDISHQNKDKYKDQRILIININNYAYLAPYVESEDMLFLKTIIPSRKMTKKFLGD